MVMAVETTRAFQLMVMDVETIPPASPHPRRAHVGRAHTCGAATATHEIKKTPTQKNVAAPNVFVPDGGGGGAVEGGEVDADGRAVRGEGHAEPRRPPAVELGGACVDGCARAARPLGAVSGHSMGSGCTK